MGQLEITIFESNVNKELEFLIPSLAKANVVLECVVGGTTRWLVEITAIEHNAESDPNGDEYYKVGDTYKNLEFDEILKCE